MSPDADGTAPARRRVYVAGPFGFTEAGRRWLADVVLPALEVAAIEALDPWEAGAPILEPVLTAPVRDATAVREACAAVGATNAALLRRCDGVLALLDGVDLDSGTCAEVGFAAGIGKVVVGLRTDSRSAGDVAEVPINLQVGYFLEVSGGSLATDLDAAIAALLRRI